MCAKTLLQIWYTVSAQKLIHAIIVIIIRLIILSFATQVAKPELDA